MRSVYFYGVIFFFTTIIFSCEKANDSISTDVVTIKIPERLSPRTESLETISDLEEVVVLETNAESIIKSVDKIICDKEKFYILDIRQKTIFIFDKSGKFITKFNKEGKGPEEYRDIRDFDFDDEGNIYLLDYRKILIFDETFKFKQYINLQPDKDDGISFVPIKLTTTDNDEFYLWQGSFGMPEDDLTVKSALFRVSKEGKILDNYIPFVYKIVQNQRFFRNYKNDVLITPIKGNDTIYSISEGKIHPEYFIDFGSKGFKEYSKSSDNSRSFHTDILESSEFLHFKFNDKENLYSAFYSKNTGKLIVEEMSFNRYNLWPLKCLCEEKFVGVAESYIVNSSFDNILKSVKRQDIYDKLSSLKGLDNENNPVLFLYTLKDF